MTIFLPRNEQCGQFAHGYRRAMLATICLAAIGCRPTDEVRSYTIVKQNTQRPATTSRSSEPTDRMLVAILPDGDKAWFFKVVAPLTEMNERADELQEFFASVRPAADQPHPKWELPAAWKEEPGTGMRAATIFVPTSGKPLECIDYVASLDRHPRGLIRQR